MKTANCFRGVRPAHCGDGGGKSCPFGSATTGNGDLAEAETPCSLSACSAGHEKGLRCDRHEFEMRKLKRRSANYGVRLALALVICPAGLAIAPIAKAQSNPTSAGPPAKGTTPSPQSISPIPATTPDRASSDRFILAFSEDFSTPAAFSERFDHGWSGEWNAGSMFHQDRNDWHADHGMMCEDPNATHR